MHSESLLQLTDSPQPASHLRPPTIEIVGSVPVRSWLRDMNHQLIAESTFASKTDQAVRVAIRRSKRTISMMKTVARRDHHSGEKFGDRSASPPDSTLIWGTSGRSGWI